MLSPGAVSQSPRQGRCSAALKLFEVATSVVPFTVPAWSSLEWAGALGLSVPTQHRVWEEGQAPAPSPEQTPGLSGLHSHSDNQEPLLALGSCSPEPFGLGPSPKERWLHGHKRALGRGPGSCRPPLPPCFSHVFAPRLPGWVSSRALGPAGASGSPAPIVPTLLVSLSPTP